MPRRDEIDPSLARHFAWSFVPPDQTAQVSETLRAAQAAATAEPPAALALPVEGETLDDEAREELRARSAAACRPLADAVAQAWAAEDDETRLPLVKRLLSRARRMGLEIVGMQEWPVEAARLLRLLVRFSPRLSRTQRESALAVASLTPLDHEEAADLLVEIARAADAGMANAIFAEEDWVPGVGDEEALVARLADVVDDGPTHPARAVAIDVLRRFDARVSAAQALRRALRLPSFAVRARALDALVTCDLPLLQPEDVVQVLRDLVTHAPPDALGGDEEREEDERLFAEALIAALRDVQPDDACEALLDWIDADHDTLWLDAGWATEALAVGFPETGAIMVDHWLRCARVYDRMKALAALRRLPDELAEPRLRRAANDPAASVRDRARQHWTERFAQAFPASPRELVGGGLLPGEVSDRFAARLGVLHGRLPDARRAMGRALLAEAPDREALVLLLQLVGDEGESHEPASPGRDATWASTIAERFGAAGVEGLCALAERYPEPESFGWMRRLGDLVESGVIAREHVGPLRELATRHVLSEDAGQIDDSLRVLALVGAPASLLDRVLSLALDDELGSWEARKLIVAWPDRSSDSRLTSDMAMALAERDWPRLEYASWMALGRRLPAARVLAQRVLEVVEEDEAALDAAVACARGLREQGALDDAWAAAALARPESPLFVVAARVWRGAPEVRARLEAALSTAARRGASAAEAALALLSSDPPLSVRDRRLAALLATAPPIDRASVITMMCVRGATFAQLAPHLEELLTSADEGVADQMQSVIHWIKSPKLDALLRQVLPRVVVAALREEIQTHLGEEPASYWAER